MATTTKAAAPAALEPIDRLEEKIKLLVSVIGRLRGEQTRAVEENARLQRELTHAGPALTAQLVELTEQEQLLRVTLAAVLADVQLKQALGGSAQQALESSAQQALAGDATPREATP